MYFRYFYSKSIQKLSLKSFKLTTQNNNSNTNLYLHNLFGRHSINKVFIFKRRVSYHSQAPRPLVFRFSRIAGVTEFLSNKILSNIIGGLVNNFSFNLLYFYFKQLFWLVPVPKHKQLLYLLRALLKETNKRTSVFSGVSITLRGKLAATGNKRKSTFMSLIGKGASSKLNLLSSSDLRLIRTPTGVLGVTSLITYTR